MYRDLGPHLFWFDEVSFEGSLSLLLVPRIVEASHLLELQTAMLTCRVAILTLFGKDRIVVMDSHLKT